ncbi:hypothetical protein F1654_02535 [Alkalicaulis satelles]|uniref:Uncharacterized protein n=1 Tax=Alkalicaulis satelles TaxID=2609175 RepID=A0A5M6ZML5_9PROT|nr:hypothetical protein [Alkalicaulis satelles]KAA5804894.1 hypothetical protein F1654_02535 [Alkalicaulis satelles]
MELLQQALDFFRAGFNQVNAVQGLIIALVAAVLLPKLARLPVFVVAATLVHVVVDALLPVLTGRSALVLPQVLELPFWRYVATLLAGYLVVILILALLKRVLLRR